MSASSVDIAVNAVRFLYAVTLGRETFELTASVSDMKRATGRRGSLRTQRGRSDLDSAQATARPTYDTVTSQTHPGSGHSWPLKKHSGSLYQVRL